MKDLVTMMFRQNAQLRREVEELKGRVVTNEGVTESSREPGTAPRPFRPPQLALDHKQNATEPSRYGDDWKTPSDARKRMIQGPEEVAEPTQVMAEAIASFLPALSAGGLTGPRTSTFTLGAGGCVDGSRQSMMEPACS
eukprot:Skav231165  [mRNA]  locus=scaffold3252:294048:294464:+ [translate_table: standard]